MGIDIPRPPRKRKQNQMPCARDNFFSEKYKIIFLLPSPKIKVFLGGFYPSMRIQNSQHPWCSVGGLRRRKGPDTAIFWSKIILMFCPATVCITGQCDLQKVLIRRLICSTLYIYIGWQLGFQALLPLHGTSHSILAGKK